ncbi:MAG: hypothetical protein AB7N54_06980 [Alphaproteobacteria bacterium]
MDPLVRIAAPVEPRRPAPRTGVRAAAAVSAVAGIERRGDDNEAAMPDYRRAEPAVRLDLSPDAGPPPETPAEANDAGEAPPTRPGALVDRLA